MNEYLVVTDTSHGYVYAERYERDPKSRTAKFYRGDEVCYTVENVIGIVDTAAALNSKTGA